MNGNQNVLVSVIIPTYLRPDCLSRALDCIFSQTYQNLDIIVVDDNEPGSPARMQTQQVMEKYLKNPSVRYIQNEKNLGGSGARNVGIGAAKGDYIAFLDDDDEYYPSKIEKQLEVFLNAESEKLALVYCDVEHVSREGEVHCVVKKRYRGNCLYEAVLTDCIASTSMWLVRKTAIIDVGGFSIVPCKQDATVLLKLLEKGYELDYVPEVLCRYYNWVGGVRISFNAKKIEGELMYFNRCRKVFGSFTPKQIKNIEFSFATRLYVLYNNRRVKKGKKAEEMLKMMRLKPLSAIGFVSVFELRRLKNRMFHG